MSAYDGRKGTAVSMLTHYMKTAFRGAGLNWGEDYSTEMEQLVDAIVREAVTQVRRSDAEERMMQVYFYSTSIFHESQLVGISDGTAEADVQNPSSLIELIAAVKEDVKSRLIEKDLWIEGSDIVITALSKIC